jgi:hypothetical protein
MDPQRGGCLVERQILSHGGPSFSKGVVGGALPSSSKPPVDETEDNNEEDELCEVQGTVGWTSDL